MPASLRSILRLPIVAFAFIVEQLRRIPGARWIERRAPWVVAVLVVAAFVALSIWMAQKSPQRISLVELSAGQLAPLQKWIIVTGDVRATSTGAAVPRYNLTDPAAPDALLIITSDVPVTEGRTTVSGTLIGGGGRAMEGFGWLGQLRADPVLVQEPDPPWLAIGLGALALFVALGARSFYPVFFRQTPRAAVTRRTTLPVGVQAGWPPPPAQAVPGSVTVEAGEPVQLRVGDQLQPLRLHSAHSSVEVGELRGLSHSQPALLVRPATGDLTLTFDSTDHRDAVFGALVAEVSQNAARSSPLG